MSQKLPGKDSIYTSPIKASTGFKFDQAIVDVFPDMIQRSVPGYSAIISAIGLLAARYTDNNSICYDLGCSLGAATISMRHQLARGCRIIAVDSSRAMVEQCRKIIARDTAQVQVELQCIDIRDIPIEKASVVVLNFTLQFIPLADRLAFLHKIYQGLLPGGILILSEKLIFDDSRQQKLQTEMYHAFKRANGYSDLEISQKSKALENVLIPETLGMHQNRLKKAGFSGTEVWFQYFNFVSMIALK